MLILHNIISFFFGRKAHVAMWDMAQHHDKPEEIIKLKRTFTVKAVSRKLAAKHVFRKHGWTSDRYIAWGDDGRVYTRDLLVDWVYNLNSGNPRYWVYRTTQFGGKTLKLLYKHNAEEARTPEYAPGPVLHHNV